jgi:hypothetical protein
MYYLLKKSACQYFWLMALCLSFFTPLFAQTATNASGTNNIKDEVVALVSRQNSAINPLPAHLKPLDGMIVSLLIDSPDGVLKPYPTSQVVQFQQAFRLKFTSSRNGDLSIFQVTQAGKMNSQPIFTEKVKYGQETISPRIFINPATQTKALLIVLHPKNTSQDSALSWAQQGFSATPQKAAETMKVFHSSVSSYLVNANPKVSGVFATLLIQ